MQRKPRLSGLSGAPRTPASRPSWTATSIPQSVGWQFIGHIVRTVRRAAIRPKTTRSARGAGLPEPNERPADELRDELPTGTTPEGALARLRYGCARRPAAGAAARRGLASSQLETHDFARRKK